MVRELCPDLDLSGIIPSRSEDRVAKEEAISIQEEAPTEPEIVQTGDTTSEQRNDDEA